MYDVGDTYPATVEVRDTAGELTNATSIAFTFTLPDGTTVTSTPSNVSVGRYEYDLPITQAGLHRFRAVSTGPATSYADVFNVADASWPSFVGLAEAKDHLNIAQTNTTYDVELRAFIASASEVVEGIVGPVARRTVNETHSGACASQMVLRSRPVLSVTSVVEDDVTLAADDYSVTPAGVLTRTDSYWPRGTSNINVTYVVGRTTVRPSVLDGTKELIRINWRPQVGGNSSVFDQGRSDDFGQRSEPGEIRLGFFIPNTVMQRLQPSARPPLVA